MTSSITSHSLCNCEIFENKKGVQALSFVVSIILLIGTVLVLLSMKGINLGIVNTLPPKLGEIGVYVAVTLSSLFFICNLVYACIRQKNRPSLDVNGKELGQIGKSVKIEELIFQKYQNQHIATKTYLLDFITVNTAIFYYFLYKDESGNNQVISDKSLDSLLNRVQILGQFHLSPTWLKENIPNFDQNISSLFDVKQNCFETCTFETNSPVVTMVYGIAVNENNQISVYFFHSVPAQKAFFNRLLLSQINKRYLLDKFLKQDMCWVECISISKKMWHVIFSRNLQKELVLEFSETEPQKSNDIAPYVKNTQIEDPYPFELGIFLVQTSFKNLEKHLLGTLRNEYNAFQPIPTQRAAYPLIYPIFINHKGKLEIYAFRNETAQDKRMKILEDNGFVNASDRHEKLNGFSQKMISSLLQNQPLKKDICVIHEFETTFHIFYLKKEFGNDAVPKTDLLEFLQKEQLINLTEEWKKIDFTQEEINCLEENFQEQRKNLRMKIDANQMILGTKVGPFSIFWVAWKKDDEILKHRFFKTMDSAKKFSSGLNCRKL